MRACVACGSDTGDDFTRWCSEQCRRDEDGNEWDDDEWSTFTVNDDKLATSTTIRSAPGAIGVAPERDQPLTRGVGMADRTCSIDGCKRAAYARTWCSAHYACWYRTGRAEATTAEERITACVDAGAGALRCWPWTRHTTTQGYGRTRWGGRNWLAHRAVWELTNGPIPPGMYVCHRCDNPPCCNPAHLFLGTAADNNLDKEQKGRARTPVGISHGCAKLSDGDVLAIRSRYAAGGVTQRALASRYGVTQATVSGVVLRKSWGHL